METPGLFLGKSLLVSGLLTLLYFTVLRGKRLHQYNRFFLLSVFPVSLLLPLLHFRWFSIPQTFKSRLSPVSLFSSVTRTDGIEAVALHNTRQHPYNAQLILFCALALISLGLLLLLVLRVGKVYRMRSKQSVIPYEGVSLVLTDSPLAPFTFLRTLFWHKAIPLDGKAGQLIFRHELAHIRQGHTYDKLICQLLTCICWFNPFYWIIQKELNIVHEFIADEYAVNPGDTEAFALMMLQSYHKGRFLVPEHYFFSSAIKRRLSMLQIREKPTCLVLRKLIVLPCLAGIILLFSFGTHKHQPIYSHPAAKNIMVLLQAGDRDWEDSETSKTLKELYAKSVTRIKELAPAYNISVQTIQDGGTGQEKQVSADIFIALYFGNEPTKQQAKSSVDLYVSGKGAYAKESNIYGSAVLDAMASDGIIPGIEKSCGHKETPCNCNVPARQIGRYQDGHVPGIPDGGMRALDQANMPAMLLVLDDNKVSIQRLSDERRLDNLCHVLLQGIVQGAAQRERTSAVAMSGIGIASGSPMSAAGCKVP